LKEEIRSWLGVAGRYPPMAQLYGVMHFVSKCLAEPSIQAAKRRAEREDEAYARRLSPFLAVLNGPFKGMRYATARSAGSTLVPKILGSYERELHGVIGRVLAVEHSDIVDIGCAEGYYAVGLGMRFPRAAIHAFDTSARARRLCSEMARLNGVSQRLALGGHCDETTLVDLPLGPRALVISDCEGYEAQLFTDRAAARLAGHDVLIEVHDAHDPELSGRLQQRFAGTHDVTVIESIDDKRKLRDAGYREIAAYDARTQHRLVREGRAGLMEWLYLTPRSAAAEPPRKERCG
jgi:hypothetical protein